MTGTKTYSDRQLTTDRERRPTPPPSLARTTARRSGFARREHRPERSAARVSCPKALAHVVSQALHALVLTGIQSPLVQVGRRPCRFAQQNEQLFQRRMRFGELPLRDVIAGRT